MGIYIVFFDLIKIAPELHGKEKCALMYQIKILWSLWTILYCLQPEFTATINSADPAPPPEAGKAWSFNLSEDAAHSYLFRLVVDRFHGIRIQLVFLILIRILPRRRKSGKLDPLTFTKMGLIPTNSSWLRIHSLGSGSSWNSWWGSGSYPAA